MVGLDGDYNEASGDYIGHAPGCGRFVLGGTGPQALAHGVLVIV
jgi:hypothetical protein